MKSLMKRAALAATVFAISVSANAVSLFGSDLYIDLSALEGGATADPDGAGPSPAINWYDGVCGLFCGSNDANSTTAVFNEFGFLQFLATSVYVDAAVDGDGILGTFFDTNDSTVLTGLGIPTSDPVNNILGDPIAGFTLPVDPGQIDIDALSTTGADNEGFAGGGSGSWELVADYTLNGTLLASGPTYTSGTIDISFRERIVSVDGLPLNDVPVLSLALTGSTVNVLNLDLFFDVTSAATGFLWVKDDNGIFQDVSTLTGPPTQVVAALDTNVNPPTPLASQLVRLGDDYVRQTTLDGSIGIRVVPVPATLLLMGVGLLGLSSVHRKRC